MCEITPFGIYCKPCCCSDLIDVTGIAALLEDGQLFDHLSLLDIDPSIDELDGDSFFSRILIGFEKSNKQHYLFAETNNVMILIPINHSRKIDIVARKSLAVLCRAVKADNSRIINYRLCGESTVHTCELIDWILKDKLNENSNKYDELQPHQDEF